MSELMHIDAPTGVHAPSYQLQFWRNGNPKKPISNSDVTWTSTKAIQTSKNVNDLAGTFSITLKDKRARQRVKAMDVGRIRLRGHYSTAYTTVLKVVVDDVRRGGSADVYASNEDTVITGRCLGKYFQINSLFLPVWDPEALLPTALTFGLGDAAKKVGGNRPFDVWRYLVRRFMYGERNRAGLGGTPNAKYWLDHHTRFSRKLGFQIPFMQFDEDALADALKRMEVVGFTEAWLDELGRTVYRQPQWDAPAKYSISTGALTDWDFAESDVDLRTYVEVIPAGDPGIDSATAQALRAGRAPVPSSYLSGGGGDTTLADTVDPDFVIDTDSTGKVTAKGRKSEWWRMQRRYGVRPEQVTSPLLFTQAQAQRQAEGLLRFYTRMSKGVTATIPLCPELRLGTTAHLHGELEGVAVDRAFYIEQISHDYVESNEGGSAHTTFVGTHGRDRGEPRWGRIVLPRFNPDDLARDSEGGVLDPTSSGTGGGEKVNGAIPGSPVPNIKPHASTHETAGLPGYPAFDYMAPAGTPVVAPVSGKITKLSGKDPHLGGPPGGPLGYSIYLDGGGKSYFLTHLDNVLVAVGDQIKQGHQIAEVADGPASWSTPHCHMGVKG